MGDGGQGRITKKNGRMGVGDRGTDESIIENHPLTS
jgi:hypothetical protein